MYAPELFRESDKARQYALIEAHNFGTLIVRDGEELEISHLPFVLDREGHCLLAHVARGNPIGRLATEGRRATAIFQGPHAYVSAGWYERPEHQVPTWNYAVVHAHGRLEGPLGSDALAALLDRLTRQHEGSSSTAWSMRQAVPGFVERLMEGIVGFTLHIERLEAKFKLSQNRSPEDQRRVIEALDAVGTDNASAVAVLMREG